MRNKTNKLELYEIEAEKPKSNLLGILALISGIISIPLGSLLFGALAIVLGLIGMKKQQKYAMAGLICGIVGIIVFFIALLVLAVYAPSYWHIMFN